MEMKSNNEDIVRVRLSKRERKALEMIKEKSGEDKDSTALKIAAWIGLNVLQSCIETDFYTTRFKKRKLKVEKSYYAGM